MKQYVFKIGFSSCKDFLTEKIEQGYRYVNHIQHNDQVILILEREDN